METKQVSISLTPDTMAIVAATLTSIMSSKAHFEITRGKEPDLEAITQTTINLWKQTFQGLYQLGQIGFPDIPKPQNPKDNQADTRMEP